MSSCWRGKVRGVITARIPKVIFSSVSVCLFPPGRYSIQPTGGGGTPLSWQRGYPYPADGGYPPPDDRYPIQLMEVPTPVGTGWGTPRPHRQDSEDLIRGGRCASCVHLGGLSCSPLFTARSWYKHSITKINYACKINGLLIIHLYFLHLYLSPCRWKKWESPRSFVFVNERLNTWYP